MVDTTPKLSMAQLEAWREDGFFLIPGFLSANELDAAGAELPQIYPTAEEFAADTDPARNDRYRITRQGRANSYWTNPQLLSQHALQFAGLVDFPWTGQALDRLVVHPALVSVAAQLLDSNDLRIYQAQLWAKYTGATNYAQPLHQDYATHTMLVPTKSAPPQQVEMFLYLHDVPEELAPTRLVPRRLTRDKPPIPYRVWPDTDPELYESEVAFPGPAGSLLVYAPDVWHRAVDLTAPGGARIWMNVSYKTANTDWLGLQSFVRNGLARQWQEFVAGSTPEELALFGFPLPGHEAYDKDVLEGMALRYPGLNLGPWHAALASDAHR
ncbi:phytanoyl-CoA dioxygenase family protein [Kitasatospora sp. NPDC001547]|uniref:phytanoyl-CoA dioxygenase family protein n=1 Tax=Kitasatospora sp. NPDC001547 TaxID=3364015 RepID=UPI00367BA65F|nr:hypothetical protein KitaXyl93_42650 [Kitasatospora sp. Xyl93]